MDQPEDITKRCQHLMSCRHVLCSTPPLPSPPLFPLLRCLDGRFNWDTSAVSETIHTPIGWSLEIQRDFKGKYETKLELSELSGSKPIPWEGKGYVYGRMQCMWLWFHLFSVGKLQTGLIFCCLAFIVFPVN